MKIAGLVVVLCLAMGSTACRPGVRPAEAPAATSAPVTASASPNTSEPESCAGCHASEVAAWKGSPHRLASRTIDDRLQPSVAHRASDALIDPLSLPMGELAMHSEPGRPASFQVKDPSGAQLVLEPSHVLGGLRREDFLATHLDRLRVLPLSWSVTRASWVSPITEELGRAPQAGSGLLWTSSSADHQLACSRCHPAAPTGAESGSAGLTCSACHGDATAHVRDPAAAPMPGLNGDIWHGCGTCHAVGADLPVSDNLPPGAPLTDRILPTTLATTTSFNSAFALDGRPVIPHGYEAIALAQSACFQKGGATCTTCHDPHAGGLAQGDPDAACRSCHASVPDIHAQHPLAPAGTRVPLASTEPGGPMKTRLPGCVDCHAPALLRFGSADRVRDHAISVPTGLKVGKTVIEDACAACHAGRTYENDADPPTRHARWATWLGAAQLARSPDDAVAPLRSLLVDADADPWTRASAASWLGSLGKHAAAAAPDLEAAWRGSKDPVLRRAAIEAHALVGAPAEPLVAVATAEPDWRVRLAACSALERLGHAKGFEQLEVMAAGTSLPVRGQAEVAVTLGASLLARDVPLRARGLLARAVELAPEHAGAWVNLGVALARTNDEVAAEQAWRHALLLQPGHRLATANLESLEAARKERAR